MNTAKQNQKKWIGTGIRWLVGIFILYLVFINIDFNQFKLSIAKSNTWLIILGLTHAPILILIAATRWRFLMNQYFKVDLSGNFVLNHYWKGLALGFFTPASLGLDAYRIVISGSRFGDYTASTVIIIIEKLMALITCMLIIVVLYPIVPITLTPELGRVFYLAYILLFASILSLFGIIIVLRNKMLSLFLEKFENYVARILSKISDKMKMGEELKTTKFSFRALAEPLTNSRITIVIALSFGIQMISAIKSQVFFCALDYNIPFIVNLFVAPMIYFIFILPVSFGSLGIREGVYILLYGLFGVPIEIALIVSFLNLSGMLLNSLIGGIIMLVSKPSGTVAT